MRLSIARCCERWELYTKNIYIESHYHFAKFFVLLQGRREFNAGCQKLNKFRKREREKVEAVFIPNNGEMVAVRTGAQL